MALSPPGADRSARPGDHAGAALKITRTGGKDRVAYDATKRAPQAPPTSAYANRG